MKTFLMSSAILILINLNGVFSCTSVTIKSKMSSRTPESMLTNLHADLLVDYNRDVIPMLAPSSGDKTNSIIVNFGVSLINLDMDEHNKKLTQTLWLRMSWMDFRLQWDPEMYGGIKKINIPANKLWLPDIEHYTSVDPTTLSQRTLSWPGNCVVYSTGFVLLIPPSSTQTYCSAAPANSFVCNMKFGSWTNDGFHMDIAAFDNHTHLELDNIQRESPYLVTSQEGNSLQTKYYDCCTEPYMSMSYNYTIIKASRLPANKDDYFMEYKNGLILSGEKLRKMRGY